VVTEAELKRRHIPGIEDIYDVSDPGEIEAVNKDARVDREFTARTCPLNSLLIGRSLKALSYAGHRFPTISPRDSVERKAKQEALWRRLNIRVPDVKSGPVELEPLADWVRGHGAETSADLLAQQILGRLFSENFIATPESWDAAVTLVQAPRSFRRFLWWSVTGKLARAKKLLASMVSDDLSAVNAIGVAVHNLVNSLRRMRSFYADANLRRSLPPSEAATRCLVAPVSLMREATAGGEINGNSFAKSSLFILNIGTASALEGAGALVFMSGSWSSCPAEQWVPAMLEGVWLRARDQARPGYVI
jgi:hypothetical protein